MINKLDIINDLEIIKYEFLEIFKNPPIQELNIIIESILAMFKNTDGKLMIFGNGGSASDSSHIAAEFVNRMFMYRKALPALSLCSDVSILTSISNDLDYNDIFSRQIEAVGNKNDIAIGLSTSGKSSNIHKAFLACKKKNIMTILFTGKDLEKQFKENVDIVVNIKSSKTARIQETYMIYWHVICKFIEDYYLNNESK